MIKNGLKTYFQSFLYVFMPLGALFLALLAAGTLLFGLVASHTQTFFSSVSSLYGEVNIDVDGLIAYLIEYLNGLSGGNSDTLISLIRQGQWLTDGVRAYFTEYNPEVLQYGEKFNVMLDVYVADIQKSIIWAYLVILLGVIGGWFLTKYIIRRDHAKRSLKKWLLNYVTDSILSATVVALVTWILSLWSYGALITYFISGLMYGLIALLEAYLVHGYKKVDIKQVVTCRNAVLLMAVNLITTVISILITVLFAVVFNMIVALAVAYALVIFTFAVTSMNAEAYVVREVNALPVQLAEGK